jgi:hypothetical protein
MRAVEVIKASGHPKIRATHATTLEITKDAELTERGDCIVATNASKGAADLSPEFLKLVKNNTARVTLTIKAANRSETVTGRGDRRLVLTHPADLVVRKSDYVCPRTLMVQADKSASDLSREFVEVLRDRSLRITLEVVAELGHGRS